MKIQKLLKKNHSALKIGVVAALSLSSAHVSAEQIKSNITATSNYIWRGVTQTGDSAAIQGGADYTISKQFYVGAWTSNVKGANAVGDYEVDIYGGYTNKFGDIDFDAGMITYQYPGGGRIDDFTEVYAGGVYKNFSAKISVNISDTNIYLEGAADFDLPDKYVLTPHVGIYNFDQAGRTDYNDVSVTLSKGELSFTVSDTSENLAQGQSDNVRLKVSWNKTF